MYTYISLFVTYIGKKPAENVDNTVAEQIKEEATTDPAVLLGWQVGRIFMWSTCYHIVNTVSQNASFGYRNFV